MPAMKGCDPAYLQSGLALGVQQVVRLKSSPLHRSRVTFSAWVYLNPVNADASRVIAATAATNSVACQDALHPKGFVFMVAEDGRLALLWSIDDAVAGSASCKLIRSKAGAEVVASQWAHVGFILEEEKGEMKAWVYLNGNVVATWEGAGRRMVQPDAPLVLGAAPSRRGHAFFLDGKVNNVAVYSGSFSSVLLWVHPGDPPFRSLPPKVLRRFLLLHYRLNTGGGPGSVVVDSSSNGMDARVVGLRGGEMGGKGAGLDLAEIERMKSEFLRTQQQLRGELDQTKKELAKRTASFKKEAEQHEHELQLLRAASRQTVVPDDKISPAPKTKASIEEEPQPQTVAPSVLEDVKGAYTEELLAFEASVDRGALVRGDYEDDIKPDLLLKSDVFGRRNAQIVKEAMEFAYHNYEEHAMGHDELRPKTGGINDKWGGHGVTLIDALDTLWLMGLKDEFYRARDWVRDSLSFDTQRKQVSFFETTIRDLGGLLSAYDLSSDPAFLAKAVDLGDRLLRAFETPTGIPMARVHLSTGKTSAYGWTKGSSILSEVGTVQLEFRSLSHHTKDPKYAKAAMKVHEIINERNKPDHGLYPIYIKPASGVFSTKQVTFGALGDSFYEYLLKIWVQGGQQEMIYREQYDAAMDGVVEVLLQKSTPSGLHYLADWKGGNKLDRKMDHLVCFVPGMLALGAFLKPDSPNADRDMRIAKAIMYTCWQMYERQPTGIAPEYAKFDNNDFSVPPKAPHYLLRPETVESMFILHYITKNPIYRVWGYKVMESLNKYCRTTYGYGALKDVRQTDKPPEDSMESFFFAETLKYLYLLQNPERVVDLKQWVFNTEAHPLRIFNWNEESWLK